MKKKAVMYGAGNIGRGFIGMLFSQSGYEVTFVDVAEIVVNTLNRDHVYPVRIVSSEGYEDIEVQNVSAVNGNDMEAVADEIACCDIMATAVGVNVLKFIIPNLTAGIRKRMQKDGGPLNIIICENLMDANKVLESMLKEQMTEEEIGWFDENVGLVEASIGRMVPVQTEQMKDGNPLRVCVEKYGFLPVDRAGFRGEIPQIQNMIPFEPFDFYIKRKLYLHNMGHAVCAYLGLYTGRQYIYESIDDAEVQLMVTEAMTESTLALSKKYGVPSERLLEHAEDLRMRFTNQALQDTCARVGGDPKRKLSPADRLIGASRLCMEENIYPAFISVGTAGAVWKYLEEQGKEQTLENAKEVLKKISGLKEGEPLMEPVMRLYEMYAQEQSESDIRRLAQRLKAAQMEGII